MEFLNYACIHSNFSGPMRGLFHSLSEVLLSGVLYFLIHCDLYSYWQSTFSYVRHFINKLKEELETMQVLDLFFASQNFNACKYVCFESFAYISL